MSQQPISLSPDLARLKEDGYEVEIRADHLVIRNVPYVNEKKQVRRDALVSTLVLAGNVAQPPAGNHVIMFAGEHPCDHTGKKLTQLINDTHLQRKIAEGFFVDYSFSSKPKENNQFRDYKDYYEKITTYEAILPSQAQVLDPNATARTWRVIENTDPESVFNYIDTASSRAGITPVTKKLERGKIAIIGGGGTGAYVLDFVAKTPVPEIHIFDRDKFLQHNAFRAPGAPSIEELRTIPNKVHYLWNIYSRMRKGIIAHDQNIDASNVELLRGMDFVFLCMDGGEAKKAIVEKLEEWGIAFVDVGMGIELVDDSLIGIVRTTTSTSAKRDHLKSRVSFAGDGHENLYAKNIQIAELSALNAALAVIKWKKLWGFYKDLEGEHFSTYTIDGNALDNDDKA
jgi:ThiF family